MDIERASDEELIEASRERRGASADACLSELYRRFYPKVAYWCLRVCGNREEAAELAQEVFLRVHSRLDTFRMDSRFSTWLYTVTRSVAINRGVQARRREGIVVEMDSPPEARDRGPLPGAVAERNETLERLRTVMERDLEPLEAKVLYLHYVDGLTLPAITKMLDLRNKSGAKAFVVGGMRKIRRKLGDAGPAETETE